MTEENSKLTVPSRSPTRTRSKDEYLSELKKQRGHLKGRLTQFKKFVDSFSGASLTKLQAAELKLRLDSASECFSKFNNLGSDIELYSVAEDIPSHFEYIESVESLYFSTMASAKCLIESCETSDNSKITKCSHVATEGSTLSHVKLPYIKLATFSGMYDEWLEYRNSYITMIHNRMDLDAIHKFHYLRSSLSGSALQVISALEFTASNYIHAWELLENRFHNHRLLIHNHIKSLFNIASLKQESAVQIRKLIDTVLRNLRALKTLNEPTESWDTLIIYLIVSKLDSSTEREWENHKGSLDSNVKGLKLENLLTFLRNRADMLEMINANHTKLQGRPSSAANNDTTKNAHQVHSYVSTSNDDVSKGKPFNKMSKAKQSCVKCNGKHSLYACFKFLNLSVNDRIIFVNENKLCINCLRSGHSINDCRFGSCMQCKRKHNSLLHLDEQGESSSYANVCVEQLPTCATTSTALHASADCAATETASSSLSLNQVLLSTALIEVADQNNKFHVARALLDNGSQHSIITEKLSKRLNAPYLQSTVCISGVGNNLTHANNLCDIMMRSKTSDYKMRLTCLVLPSITPCLPSTSIEFDYVTIPDNIRLADPQFATPSEIDLLIGADKFWELLYEDRIRLPNGPFLQNSKLGWLISGPINKKHITQGQVQCNFTVTLDERLRKFWEIEDLPHQVDRAFTQDERKCEDLFIKTTKREKDGRFSVCIPLREPADTLGDSYTLAKKRFMALERKLDRLPLYKRMYCDFMREYEALGHMTRVNTYSEPSFFLPHHGVYREHSSTTKLRVVFDGSAKTTSQKSLNDIQLAGPALQNDIFSILLRFRQYRYVACADVEKLFRQVLIQPQFRSLQNIVWRETPTDELCIYQLNTVTYGTSSAPYLSMRCIRQLALECEDKEVARIIKEDYFVDDLLTGHDSYESLMCICEKISNIMLSGCFPLRKWTFNFDPIHHSKDLCISEGLMQNKTLGLGWYNDSDQFHFTSKLDTKCDASTLTKRTMLSIISQIYDPLGILAPAVIMSKILLQKLWLCKIDWDTPVSTEIALDWSNFIKTLFCLNELRVPRQIKGPNDDHVELHIFSDASQQAYGACAYARTYSNDTDITIRLICAKSKVAPIKTISIPRLELCGALIGARLYKKIIDSLRLTFTKVYFWTDSTIVMGWVRMSPHLLKTFVQNRVTEINELTGDSVWLHVNSKDNPADLLSRGQNLDLLINSDLWWNGPSFLKSHDLKCKNKNDANNNEINSNLPDMRTITVSHVIHSSTWGREIFLYERYSSFERLKRVGAYVLRFIHNLRMARDRSQSYRTGLLSVAELQNAQRAIVRCVQMQSFPDVYSCLQNNLPLKDNKQFKRVLGLNVFMDKHELIRVGGRIGNASSFDYDKKHPVLLCAKHHFTLLLFRCEHKRLLHGGPLLLLSNIRECWWPLGARNLAKKVTHECVTCNRFKGKTLSPIMGNLPNERLEPGFPFIRTGVDYAGPISILNRKGRGAQLSKGYIALFICLVTRAIHLELVTSLTTNDYLLSLKRFISRRGKPNIILSDNGTNFVGSKKELSSFLNKSTQTNVIDSLSNDGIKLLFTPPYSPHIGGLMERGVRSCKFHLRRVVGNARLTYEEFSTVLTQIEAVLNSRPLSPMSTDPNDLSPLTPAHFLIGRPLVAPACEDLAARTTATLTRYHRVEQLRQHFWRRWSKEYVAELQTRTKWKSNKDDIAMDTMVLIKEDNMPPLKWKLGRIIRVFPGNDGVSRVADIRTATGVIRRSFAKICPLPAQPEDPTS